MNFSRKWRVWLVMALLVVAAGFGINYWQEKKSAPEYKTTKIEKGSITASVSASGTLSPVVSVQVGSQVSGQLRDVLVDFNSEVKRGQLIARIDPETFEYKVRQAQADVDAARAQVLTQQANIAAQNALVAKAEVDLAEAKRDLERKRQLVEKGFISGAERDKAQATYNAAVEQVNSARAQAGVAAAGVRNAEAVVKQREAALAQAKIDLGRTAIKAPVDGVVIKRSVERGQTVAASLQAPELFIIAENLTDMQVDAAIDESEIGRVRLGQKATFTVDAFPGRSFEGTVKQIRKAAQNVSNVVTYTVVISASNPGKELLPGMTANVRVITDTRNDVLKVANAALRFRPTGTGALEKRDEKKPDTQPGDGQRTQQGGQLAAQRERLEKELQLTDVQRAKLDSIYAGMREKFQAARDLPEGERQAQSERNRNELRTQISDMLTPEQKAKYELIAAEFGDKRGGGARGRIYTLDEKRQLTAIEVRLGLTDGSATEVISPDVKEGMEIITGTIQSNSDAAKSRQPAGPRMF